MGEYQRTNEVHKYTSTTSTAEMQTKIRLNEKVQTRELSSFHHQSISVIFEVLTFNTCQFPHIIFHE